MFDVKLLNEMAMMYSKDLEKIQIAERKMISNKEFLMRLETEYVIIKKKASDITKILREYLAVEDIYGGVFNQVDLEQILLEHKYIAFLITANLVNRVKNLKKDSSPMIKLRICNSIINYVTYKN